MKRRLISMSAMLAVTAISNAAGQSQHADGSAALGSLLSGDNLRGIGVTINPVSLKEKSHLHDFTLSTFIVDYAPGGSVVLQRAPSSGYVLVHVLSGTIRASAWKAGVGNYRTGETWVEPAFASDITTSNASTKETARTFVVQVRER